ncbi:MAG: acetyl-coenzyme A synthetase N-terminal domain-containing protein, partial [Pseudomonadota bacterium]
MANDSTPETGHEELHHVPQAFAEKANLTPETYQDMYDRSVGDPEGFWREQGQRLKWIEPYTNVKSTSYEAPDFRIKWYEDGVLNVTENCLDRHLETRGEKTAIIWEGDDPSDKHTYTYRELHRAVCRFANVLKDQGARKGDRVTIYMPMIPEAAIAMLA